jgi:hypothetical protein
MYKKIHSFYITISLLLVLVSCQKANVSGVGETLHSTVSNPLTTPWIGFGYNQDPLDHTKDGQNTGVWNNAHWNVTMERMNYLKPSLVRIVLYRYWFNPSGVVGNYDWDSPYMLSVYQVLDYYKAKNIPVMTGLWQSTLDHNDHVPFYTTQGDSSFQQLQVDLFQHLYNVKGYHNIRWYTPTNEPKGMGMDFQTWSVMMINTYNGFSAANLPLSLFCGADSWDDWTALAAQLNQHELSGYDHHYYLNSGIDQLISGSLALQFENEVATIHQIDPTNKPVFLSEAGFMASSSIDYWFAQNPIPTINPTTTTYGLLALDYGIQVACSGESGALAWSLDGYDYGKDPGMWNIAGNNGGIQLRPWYYAWSLLCRYFPAGGVIYPIRFASSSVRGVALKQTVADKSYWSFAFVNWGTAEVQTIFSIPNVKGGDFTQFILSASSSGDGTSLSLPKENVTIQSFNDGVLIKIPASGGLIMTSMESASGNQ